MSRTDWERVKRIAADAWELGPTEREPFALQACGSDDGLREEVLSLLASMDDVGDRFETPAAAGAPELRDALCFEPAVQPGQRIGAWTVVRLLGHGGMGTVYLAERAGAEFHQRAAIKIVRGAADAMLRRRFEEERRILATLEHPHIARLIDGGTTVAGLPYVAMEFVEGRPLDAYCAAGRLDIRHRLEAFRLVCLAVNYAHQRLVIHRDLKSSNILVTADGVPKLLDFGIAKIVAADGPAEATRTLFRVLTPECASPEQLRGDPITTASDIYALGVLLYRLLVGGSPYRPATDSDADLIRAVCEQAPEAPSAAARTDAGIDRRQGIDRDLDRIVLMALRKEPERRYSTAEQFGEDIARYLAGRPVMASPDSTGYRARKFVSRNRVAVGAAAGFLIALGAGVAATAWQARAARQERNRAQHEFNAVRSLAGSVLGELHDAVERLPGSLAARELLVRRATEYLDALAPDAEHDAGLRREVALGYARLGQIQGPGRGSNTGDITGARRSFERAVRLFASLDAQTLDVTAAASEAESYLALVTGDADDREREAHMARAEAISERLAREHPRDARALASSIAYWNTVGNAQEQAGNYAGALKSFSTVAGAAETTFDLSPDRAAAGRNLSIVYRKVGTEYELLGQLDEAEAFYRKAIVVDERRHAAGTSLSSSRLDLSFSQAALASVLQRKGESADALALYRRAVDLRRAAADADPNDEFAKRALSRGHERVAVALGRMGDLDGSLQAQTDRVAGLDEWRQAHPDLPNAWSDETAAAHDAVEECLDFLEAKGHATAAQASRVGAMLAQVVALQEQWSHRGFAKPLPPSKADVDRAAARLRALRIDH